MSRLSPISPLGCQDGSQEAQQRSGSGGQTAQEPEQPHQVVASDDRPPRGRGEPPRPAGTGLGHDQLETSTFLNKLVAVPKLNEHYIGEYLEHSARRHPGCVLDFLVARLHEHARREASGDYHYDATPDQLRRRDFSGVSKAPTYAAVLRRIRNSLNEADASVSAIVDLFWRIGSPDTVTLAVLDEWLHQSVQTAGLLESLIRRAPQALALTRPRFALHLSVESARLDDELGVRIESARSRLT